METLRFGPAGVPHSARSSSSPDGIARVAELGLTHMELEFVQSVRMREKTAAQVRQKAQDLGITLSAHAPYYINLNAKEVDKLAASRERLLQTARVGRWCGALSVAFHPAFYGGDPPAAVFQRVKEQLEAVLSQLRAEGNPITLRPEVMGRHSQFGDLEETLRLCRELPGLQPVIDWGHQHARTGRYNTYPEFIEVLDRMAEVLGPEALHDVHFHVEGIEYNHTGERKHITFQESDFNYREFLQALLDREVRGMVVCESPNLEEDALLLQQTYQELAGATLKSPIR
ncbi:MAG: TIM barrel protein [Chloroflexi bacterium]|nr:TIM barrel protein [Chloroflexota bacterium]